MGRGGGGGGGRSFGGGGGRSFGGRIGGGGSRGGFGGGRSAGSGFGGGGRSFGSGFGGSSRGSGGRPIGGFGFSGPRRTYSGGGGSGCGGGCLTTFVILFIVLVLIVIVFSFMGTNMLASDAGGGDITTSTIEREALPSGAVTETGYYTDELGWIDNPTTLQRGMSEFYRQTGVQPYLYITDTVNGTHSPNETDFTTFANQVYDELFTDEAHLLLIFQEYYSGEYSTWYLCGTQAKTVIDSEAADILLDYLDRYYYESSWTDAEYFANSFSNAGERIMTVTRSPWLPVAWVAVGAVILIVAFIWWRKAKKQKNLEAKQTEDMLNTPLQTFGSTEAADLAKKYEDQQSPLPQTPAATEGPEK